MKQYEAMPVQYPHLYTYYIQNGDIINIQSHNDGRSTRRSELVALYRLRYRDILVGARVRHSGRAPSSIDYSSNQSIILLIILLPYCILIVYHKKKKFREKMNWNR